MACAGFPRPRARGGCTCTCGWRPSKASTRCGGPRWRSRGRSSDGCRAAPRAAARAGGAGRTRGPRRCSLAAPFPQAEGRAASRAAEPGAVVSLPLAPPLKPQLAVSRKELPEGEQYVYEVKLDGFRCLAFVDGKETFLQSRGGKPFSRYFPELSFPPGHYVLDGEV